MRGETGKFLLASTVLLSLAACEHFPRVAHNQKLKAIPSDMPRDSGETVVDRLYAQAVRAIDRREYDTALDILQLAGRANTNDPRVFNALGVIYDKLGRFDLSTRYYDLAEKADPGSKVVAMNRRYSLVLQQGGPAPGASAVMMAANLPPAPNPIAPSAATQAPPLPVTPVAVAALAHPAVPLVKAAHAPAAEQVSRMAPAPIASPVPPTPPAPRAEIAAAAPVHHAPAPPMVSEDDLYLRAVVSIRARAFGEALGELTTAQAVAPRDPRVLSALGVVYDWLGRFDLSARYYDLAEAADPGSLVVSINRRYSRILQRHGGAVIASQVVMPRDASNAPVPISPVSPPAILRKTALRAPIHKPATGLQESHAG
jgi:Flp pilus assembly protein TadD